VSGTENPDPNSSVSPWRIGAGVAVLAALALLAAFLAPVYSRNLELERFLRGQPAGSEDAIRQVILHKGHLLGLDIPPDHLQIRRSATDGDTEVRYAVRVNLPLYTVYLHFASNIRGGSGTARQ